MNCFLIPKNSLFVEHVAKAIAKRRLFEYMGGPVSDEDRPSVDRLMSDIFDAVWSSDFNEEQKNMFREDAKTAIDAINLKLMLLE